MKLTAQQEDRAAGVLLGQAVGDALGVPYEFGTPPPGEPEMKGGGLGDYAPGEWSDDTQMAACIAGVAGWGEDLTTDHSLDAIAERFEDWYAGGPADVGRQTRAVLSNAERLSGRPAERLLTASRSYTEVHSHSAGNGALMRTGIVGLTKLDDQLCTAAAARAVAELTHSDPLAIESCVLWSEAVRVAVLEGRFDLTSGLRLVNHERRSQWSQWIDDATNADPATFSPNGFTVTALQCAWAAISSTDDGTDSPLHFQRALTAVVQAGDDTDTVAAVAGMLVGGRYGASAIPAKWRRKVHGWPGLNAADLVGVAVTTARGGLDDSAWPGLSHQAYLEPGAWTELAVPHPHDEGVLLGTWRDFRRVDELEVDAVVSLCRVGLRDMEPADIAREDHITVWLVDSDDPKDNAHLDFVLDDTADLIAALRAEGKRVLLHSVSAQQRTPSVALRYAIRQGADPDVAARDLREGLPSLRGGGRLWKVARQVGQPDKAERVNATGMRYPARARTNVGAQSEPST